MEFSEFLNRLWYLGPLLWLICALLWMIRGRLCLGSILGGFGFLLLVLNGILYGLWRGIEEYGFLDSPDLYEMLMELLPYTSITFLLAQVFILLGFATTRYRAAAAKRTDYDYDDRPMPPRQRDTTAEGEAAWAEPVRDDWDEQGRDRYDYDGYRGGDMGPPATDQEPGWGLTGGWITFSALAWIFGAVALVLVLDAGGHMSDDELIGIVIAYGLWFITGVPAIILFFVWLHRAWSAVPPEYRSTSPGKAVGYMFIPFFNLYWVFRAIPGLSASTRRAQLALNPREAGGGGAYGMGVVTAIIAIIPYINMLSWFFFLVWIIMANADRNRLIRSRYAR